jgi:hypothetical protein
MGAREPGRLSQTPAAFSKGASFVFCGAYKSPRQRQYRQRIESIEYWVRLRSEPPPHDVLEMPAASVTNTHRPKLYFGEGFESRCFEFSGLRMSQNLHQQLHSDAHIELELIANSISD